MVGELCALGAALLWSVSVILFKRSEAISPQGLNLFKNVSGAILLGLTLPVMGLGIEMDRPTEYWVRLVVSGVLGIAIADTLIFMALRRLGAALLAIVDCSYAPVTLGLSVLLLGEQLSLPFVIGAMLVVGGVLYATIERRSADPLRAGQRPGLLAGVVLGVSGIAAMAVGIVIVKPVLETSGLVEITFLRLLAGIGGQVVWIGLVPSQRGALRALVPSTTWYTLLPASLFGSYLALLLWLGGFKWTDVSIAAVLNQLSSVFTIVLARVILKEPVSPRRAFGAAGALAGALVILLL